MSDSKTKELEEIKEILDRLGVPFFLEYGTLLGAYRDGDFLDGDEDIDIGVIGIEHLNGVREAVKLKNFRVMEPNLYLSLRRNFPVDIHFYQEGPASFQCWVKPGKPYLFFPKRFKEQTKIAFKGKEYGAPSPIEDFLTWVYGDWKNKENKISSAYGWRERSLV